MDIFRLDNEFTRACNQNQTANTDALRLSIDGIIGTAIAMGSVTNNILLLFVFSTSTKLRREAYANPVLLALFDSMVSIAYIGVTSIQSIAYYFQLDWLVSSWVLYVRELYCFQHICITICNFLLVIASIERYLANSPKAEGPQNILQFTRKKCTFATFIGVVALATLLKGTLLFETSIIHLPQCPPLERFVPVMNWSRSACSTIRFLTRKSLTVLIPFFIILYSNWVVLKWHRMQNGECLSEDLQPVSGSLRTNGLQPSNAEGVRIATRTLLLVVGCFFTSNSIATVINFWEFFDPLTLEQHYYVYLLIQDCSCLLTVTSCFCRLPIYCLSDARIRKAVGRAVLRAAHRAHPLELPAKNLEKWSIVFVSNSLRSNVTVPQSHQGEMMKKPRWMSGRGSRKHRARIELANEVIVRKMVIMNVLNLALKPADKLIEESTTADCEYYSDQEKEKVPCILKKKDGEVTYVEQSDQKDWQQHLAQV